MYLYYFSLLLYIILNLWAKKFYYIDLNHKKKKKNLYLTIVTWEDIKKKIIQSQVR